MTPNIFDRIIDGYRIKDQDELMRLIKQTPREELYEGCHRITRTLMSDGFDTCSIIDVRSGKCPEDCKWCAQSAHFATNCQPHDIMSTAKVVEQAKHNRSMGIKRFSLVASGKRPSNRENEHYEEIFREIGLESDIHLCASLGLASREQLQKLYDAGCTTYHCNMESAPSFFPTLVSTHTQAEKQETLANAKAVGMLVCSGGIIGMGETRVQRAEFALFLASLGIQSIPINVLHPIKGTPLGEREPLSGEEVLLAICMFRLANPTAFLRFSGGRALLSADTQKKALYIGINSAITGDLLTTTASVTDRDMLLFREMNYDTEKETSWK